MATGYCNWPCWLVFLMLISALVAVLSGLVYVITNPVVEAVFADTFVISSNESDRYLDWVCKYSRPSENPDNLCSAEYVETRQYEVFVLFNLTNLAEVQAGGQPQYRESGQYRYRRSSRKFDVEFLEGGDQVSYMEFTYGQGKSEWIWSQEGSCELCNNLVDKITTINGAYMGAVAAAGNESNLVLYTADAHPTAADPGAPTISQLVTKLRDNYILPKMEQLGLSELDLIDICQGLDNECSSLDDAALVQWGVFDLAQPNLQGLFNESAHSFDPQTFPYPVTELFTWAPQAGVQANAMTLDILRLLLDGVVGLRAHPVQVKPFTEAVLAGQPLSAWGITDEEQGTVVYTYLTTIAATYSLDTFEAAVAAGGGLFSTRTVQQWLFEYTDPLLSLFQNTTSNAFRHNDVSEADAASYKKPWRMYTGLNNISQISEAVRWQDLEEVPYWQEPVPVTGNVQDGQYLYLKRNGNGQFPGSVPDIAIWSRDHARPLRLVDTGVTVTGVRGIPLRRFQQSDDTYEPSDFYRQPIQGFASVSEYRLGPPFRLQIVGNVTAKAPIYMSNPRFWQANETYVNKVALNVAADEESCATIVDIEPYTGSAMYSLRRIQANFYLPTSGYETFNAGVQPDTYYPFLFSSVESIATDTQGANWEDTVGRFVLLEEIIFITGLCLGLLAFVVCLVTYRRLGRKSADYEAIN